MIHLYSLLLQVVEMKITAGELLQAFAFVFAVFGAYNRLSNRLTTIETKLEMKIKDIDAAKIVTKDDCNVKHRDLVDTINIRHQELVHSIDRMMGIGQE